MPTFRYLGIPKTQQQNIMDAHLEPLESDDNPHPRLGGFPLVGQNELGYYDGEHDKPKTTRMRAKKRDEYRAERSQEMRAHLAKSDAMMAFTVGRKPGRMQKGTRIEFPKGAPVEVPERHTKLIAKLRALSGQSVKPKVKGERARVVVTEPLFEEVTAPKQEQQAKPQQAPKKS
jgi:hypothetical protein